MKKQVIRLTESDLHNIIKESVQNILSELDWRTYDSAMNKSHERGINALSEPEYEYNTRRAAKFKDARNKKQNNMYDGVNSDNYLKKDEYPSYELSNDEGKKQYVDDYIQTPGITPKRTSLDKQLRGASNIAKYNRGDVEYNKEKGKWMDK